MAITLPTASDADTFSQANNTAEITAVQNYFIANVTVLINNAIANGLFYVEPYSIPLVDPTWVSTYFTSLGYTVLYPLVPTYPYQQPFPAAGFPGVIPPGYVSPMTNPFYDGTGAPARYKISWTGA